MTEQTIQTIPCTGDMRIVRTSKDYYVKIPNAGRKRFATEQEAIMWASIKHWQIQEKNRQAAVFSEDLRIEQECYG